MLRFQTAWWLSLVALRVICGIVNACEEPFYGNNCLARCGANLTNKSGVTIFSPGYQRLGQYAPNEQCDWYIVPHTENFSVFITFMDMDIEPGCCDHLAIYGDPPTYSTLVALFNGSLESKHLLYDGPLRLYFETDGIVNTNHRGFRLSYDILGGITPRFVSVTNDTNVLEGGEVLLPCHVTGHPLPVVTWYKDGIDVHFILQSKFIFQGNDLLLKDVVEKDSGFFKCKAENYLNSTEQVFHLDVHVAPLVVTHPTSVHFENIFDKDISDYSSHNSSYDDSYGYDDYSDGQDNQLPAVFRCDISGSPRPMVYWKKDGRILLTTNLKYDWLVIKHVTASHEGNYSCIANNSVGSVESRNASLTIGNVLTCCFSTTIGISSYTVAESPRLYLNISSNYYNVSSITMTKISGNRQLQLESMERHHYSRFWAYFRGDKATYSDTGVYRCHLVLSNSTSNSTDMDTNVTVSFYTPIFVRGPPRVTVSPSSVILLDFNERLNIICSVFSPYSNLWLYWYKNNGPVESHRIRPNGFTVYRSYLRVNTTLDDVDVGHYTCIATSSSRSRLRDQATVSVVTRGKQRGWGQWTESPCSETCGSKRGIRLRSRHCYNDNNNRCNGSSTGVDVSYCYPQLRYCPTDGTQAPFSANYNATLSTPWPRTTSTVAHTEFASSCDDSGQPVSVATAAAISAVVTGVVAVAVTVAVAWCLRRSYRKQLESLRSNVHPTSAVDSHRYVSTEPKFSKPSKKATTGPPPKYVSTDPKFRKPSKEAATEPSSKGVSTESKLREPSKKASTRPSPRPKNQAKKPKAVPVKYSNDDDQLYQPVDVPEHYTPMLQRDSQNVNDEEHQQPGEEPDSAYLQPVSLGRTEEYYLPMASQLEEDTVYSNVPNPRDEEVYANQ